jgi:rhodanese-related sulfurtransferase/rubrerythrin
MKTDQDYDDIQTLFPEEVKTFLKEHQEGTYTLLDVRQPGEYEQSHMAGAKLIPLPQLPDLHTALDVSKPIIVYCMVGGRSRMAAQLLMGLGHRNVFHMQGGIQAWEEPTASGPREFHLKFVRGDESAEEIIRKACLMEDGLKKFHEAVKAKTDDPDMATLLTSLIKAEENHKRTLMALADAIIPDTVPDEANLMEGGIDMDEFLKQNEPFLKDVPGYLDLAMLIETQALDLYLRMAEACTNEQAKQILFRIGNEEKIHMEMLGRYLDGIYPSKGEG